MRSPYNLLQEIYHPNEWRILICCVLLNQTSGVQVHQIIKDLFDRYPDPLSMSEAVPEEVFDIIKTCGLGNKRTTTLIRMSTEYLTKPWSEPQELYGIGEYANDSWRIFIRGEIVSPKDKELKKYVAWKRSLHR